MQLSFVSMVEEKIYNKHKKIMAKIASKKNVNNNAGLLNVISGLDKKKVKEVADFGGFYVVVLKDEVIFRTHAGFEIRSKAWIRNMDGSVADTTLYTWLTNLVAMKNTVKGKENEIFPETDVSYQDMLDSMIIMTEANLTYPMAAFVDPDKAVEFANNHLEWLRKKSEELEAAMNTPITEETEEDLKKNFIHDEEAILTEQIAKELKKEE